MFKQIPLIAGAALLIVGVAQAADTKEATEPKNAIVVLQTDRAASAPEATQAAGTQGEKQKPDAKEESAYRGDPGYVNGGWGL